jgi:TadE-like protein
MRVSRFVRGDSGQSLIETAIALPVLLSIVLNAINFGYVFLMALNITSSARSSAIYSVMGGATPAAIPLPNGGPPDCTTGKTVSDLACRDLTGAVFSPSTMAGFQVCSQSVGVLNVGTTNMHTDCATYGSVGGGFPASQPDPELNAGNTAPAFLLNRVDVAYQFSPPVPLTPFNILVLAAPICTSSGGNVTCTFYRHAVMREMQ